MTDNSSRTHVVLVLDETGSMEGIREETVGALKEWLSGLKADLPRETPVTFVQFNSARIARTVDGQELDVVSATVFDDYAPNHMTPLYDAVGQTIAETEQRVTGEDGVIFTVMTDGLENASKEFTAKQVRDMVERLKAKGWTFMFLGADIDAYEVGGGMGFAASHTVLMKKDRMGRAMALSRAKARDYDRARREFGAEEAAERAAYSDEDRFDLGEDV
jgi:hypothetical protein